MEKNDRDRLIELTMLLADIENHDSELKRNIVDTAERLKNMELNLVLLGAFNRGKSTLANCFLGKEILPSGVVPLTSIVTEIRFGHKEGINVLFSNKKSMSFPLRKLHEFVTEKNNPKNRKKVKKVGIQVNSDFLKNNITLIDTPGISSTFIHNTIITQDYIPNCDAVIFLISADSPLSNEEMEFVKSIRQYSSKIFFVLNKSDYVTKAELKEMVSHIESELSAMDIRCHVIPVSARLGLEGRIKRNKILLRRSGVTELRDFILKFLSKEKTNTIQESTRIKLNSIAKSLYNRFQSEHSVINMTVQDINKKSGEFNKQFDIIKHSALLYSGSLDSESEDLIHQIAGDMKDAKENINKSIYDKVISDLKTAREGKFVDIVNFSLDRHVKIELEKWRKTEDIKILEKLNEIEKRYAYLINDTNRRIKDASSHTFHFSSKQISANYKINFRTGFYFRTEGFGQNSFTIPSLSSVLPSVMQRKRIFKDLYKKITENVEMNLGRIRADYQERIEKGRENFKRELEDHLRNTRKEIEQGLKTGKTRAKLTITEKTKVKAELDRKLTLLSKIIKETE